MGLDPYLLLGQPFLLDGEGVNLELLPKTIYKDASEDVVKVIFNAGTRHAPDHFLKVLEGAKIME